MREMQAQIAAMLMDGYSVEKIMKRLHVSKAHVEKVKKKMSALENVG